MSDFESGLEAPTENGVVSEDEEFRQCDGSTSHSTQLHVASGDEQPLKEESISTSDKLDNPSSPSSAHKTIEEDSPHGVAVDNPSVKEIMHNLLCDEAQQLKALQLAKEIVSTQRDSVIDSLIQGGVISKCIQFLANDQNRNLQFEAVLLLVNISSGNESQTNAVVDAGAVEPLIDLLGSPHDDIADQAVGAFGNIAGDGPILRDFLINKGVFPPLVALVNSTKSPTLLRTAAWTLSNLCRFKNPRPSHAATRLCIPALVKLLMMTDIETVGKCRLMLECSGFKKADTCWAFSYLSDGSNESTEEIFQSGVVPRLVELLDCKDFTGLSPCLRTLGNMAAGTCLQTECVVKAGILPCLAKLLGSENNYIVTETAWIVSNVATGTADYIPEILQVGIVPLLIKVLKEAALSVQTEAVWAVANIADAGNVHCIVYLCQNGVIQAMCDMLKCTDWKILSVVLNCLDNILKVSKKIGRLERDTLAIELAGGLDLLEDLQNHEVVEVYNKVYDLLGKYFSDENGDDDDSSTVNQ